MSVTRRSPWGRPPGPGQPSRQMVAVTAVVVVAAVLGVLSAISGRAAVGVGVAIGAVPVLLALVQAMGGRDGGPGGAAS